MKRKTFANFERLYRATTALQAQLHYKKKESINI